MLHALNHSNPSEKQYIEEIMAKKMEVGSSEIDRVREIFINCRSISYAMSLSNGLVRNAKNSIEGLEDSEAKSKLQHIADLAAKRIEEQALDTFIQH